MHPLEAMTGMTMKKRTHRGRRKKKQSAPSAAESSMDTANSHIDNARAAKDPKSTRKHLFSALQALKTKKSGPIGRTTNAGVELDCDPISIGKPS